MKIRFFFPLLAYLIVNIAGSVFFLPGGIEMVLQFSSFLFFFSIAYYVGLRQTLQNRDPVVKVGERTPYVLPMLFLTIPTVFLTAVLMPRDARVFLCFSSAFLLSLATYALGIVLLVRDLKNTVERNKRARPVEVRDASKRLLLINPVNPRRTGLTVNRSSSFPPLGLGIVAALTSDDFQIKLIDENIAGFQYEPADLVGITAFTAAANRAYEIAAHYRNAGTPVVMGGIHGSMLSEEALRHVDCVVIGEAESVWQQVLDDFRKGGIRQTYRGVHTDLSGAVIPRRDLFSDEYLFATVQTSRGCPMDCSFCSVSTFNGRKYRQRPVADVLDELQQIPERYVFFVDDNIVGYGAAAEQRSIDLFKGMIERGLDKSWFCQASLNIGSNKELLRLAAKSGCRMVLLGLESPDPVQLREMNKRVNLRLEYDKALQNINRHGIAVMGAFIYGSDRETAASMRRKTDYILDGRIDVIDTTILTPLPGTRLFNRLRGEKRLLYADFPKDWDRYDMTELTFELRGMEAAEFSRLHAQYTRQLRSRRTLWQKCLKTMLHTKSIEAARWAYSSNINLRNVASGTA